VVRAQKGDAEHLGLIMLPEAFAEESRQKTCES